MEEGEVSMDEIMLQEIMKSSCNTTLLVQKKKKEDMESIHKEIER